MTGKLDFGLFYLPSSGRGGHPDAAGDYHRIIAEVLVAEQLGFQTAWFAEHHFSGYGGSIPSIAVLGAAVAARTSVIRIGAGVAVLPLHNAVELAESFAMLDVLSCGRLDLGVGRGFLPLEFDALGIEQNDRRTLFDEGLDVLLAAWRLEPLTYRGKHYRFENIDVEPKPVQRPHPPVWVAASTEQESFELAGRSGHHLLINPYTRTPDEIAQGLEWYFAARKRAGFGREHLRITANQHLFVAANAEQARDIPREYLLRYLDAVNAAFAHGRPAHAIAPADYDEVYPAKVMFGTPEAIAERIMAWQAIGVTGFCFMTQFGGLPPQRAAASLELFAREVMPCFP